MVEQIVNNSLCWNIVQHSFRKIYKMESNKTVFFTNDIYILLVLCILIQIVQRMLNIKNPQSLDTFITTLTSIVCNFAWKGLHNRNLCYLIPFLMKLPQNDCIATLMIWNKRKSSNYSCIGHDENGISLQNFQPVFRNYLLDIFSGHRILTFIN